MTAPEIIEGVGLCGLLRNRTASGPGWFADGADGLPCFPEGSP